MEIAEPILIDGVYVGWLGLDSPSDLGTIVDRLPTPVQELPWVLVTSVDSGRGTWVAEKFKRASNSDIIQQITYRPLTDGSVMLDAFSFRQLIASETFFSGFDEVWFFSNQPHEGPPVKIRITSETRITQEHSTELQKALSQWVFESGAVLGLGDGVGLNFVTTDVTIAQILFSLVNGDASEA